jgi:hypothetical protein
VVQEVIASILSGFGSATFRVASAGVRAQPRNSPLALVPWQSARRRGLATGVVTGTQRLSVTPTGDEVRARRIGTAEVEEHRRSTWE